MLKLLIFMNILYLRPILYVNIPEIMFWMNKGKAKSLKTWDKACSVIIVHKCSIV